MNAEGWFYCSIGIVSAPWAQADASIGWQSTSP